MHRDKLMHGRLGEIYGRTLEEASSEPRLSHEDLYEAYAQANQIMNTWIYDEKAVIVKCTLYVWTIITIASILAFGGIAIGFTVQDHIAGVDPFGITTYCWVLAGFIVLISKSVRVDTWSWRDFLRARVQCRSVSELHAVTGIPEPLILAKLLNDEETSILNTRGPFNAAFRRKVDNGFSIDRPITMWTMLLSGLIMVKVSTARGFALICLDVRRGTRFSSVGHSNGLTINPKEHLVCTDMLRQDSRLPLKVEGIDWRGLLGIYRKKDARFY
ncbi:hypothetical protein F5884DRAFT_788548 [Xylogone sp. PMI_703]|nr:hypothetical protein F5884DRAFT_788548 [Xylogone sp. PMI_703]